MPDESKTVHGKLFDLETNTPLGEGEVIITRTEQPDEHPKYQATITLQGLRPDLDAKVCVLQLNEQLSGEVMLAMPQISLPQGLLDPTQTTFDVHWQGATWISSDWFHSLGEDTTNGE